VYVPVVAVTASPAASQANWPTAWLSLWYVEAEPMTVNGSPYSEYVQLVESATRTPPIVHERELACMIPKLCDSSCAITRRSNEPLLYEYAPLM
jgi:hypothetical protein